jgi:hypothetical protein
MQMNYVKPHAQPGKRAFTFNLFIESLCEYLVALERKNASGIGRKSSDETEKALYGMYIMMLKGHPMQLPVYQ